MPNVPKTLIVIPAWNESCNIAEIVIAVKRHNDNVLVINDASSDDTAAIARKAGAIVVSHPYNLGAGAAIGTGCRYALAHGYDCAVHLDADGQHNPDDIPFLLQSLGDADICIGSRFSHADSYNVPLARRLGNRLFSSVAQYFSGQKILDCTSGYRALSRKAIEFYASDAYPDEFFDADMLILASRAGCKIINAPVAMRESNTGKSMHAGILRPCYYVARMTVGVLCAVLRSKKQ